jgi:hypothetical protein
MQDIQDIYQAIDKLSMLLAMRIENSVRKRGWPGRPAKEKNEIAVGDRTTYITSLRVALPLGQSVTFVPEPEPLGGDQGWLIRIRRSDGVVRKSWVDGVRVAAKDGAFHLFSGDRLLTEALLNQILDELSTAGLSGHALMIAKAWVARFGPLPAAIYEVLAGAQDVEQLERMHEVVLTEPTQGAVETKLGKLS